MAGEFVCSCGQTLANFDESAYIECPQCHRMFPPQEPENVEDFVPLAESKAAQFFAWGCLFPVGFLFVIFGVNKILLHDSVFAIWCAVGAVLLFALFGWILKKQKYTARRFAGIATISFLIFVAIVWTMWTECREEAELDAKFSTVLAEAQRFAIKPSYTQLEPRPKYLPVLLRPSGYGQHSQPPKVFCRLYSALPEELRAKEQDDVQTIILIEWWYKLTGIYKTIETLKMDSAKIYQGGCSLTFVDRKTQTAVLKHDLESPERPPEIREHNPVSWHSPQPSMAEVLDYIKSLR
jgi:hypothetical protein